MSLTRPSKTPFQPSRDRTKFRRSFAGAIPVALVYPNKFNVGMSNLGFQFVYEYLNSRREFVAERFFFSFETKDQAPVSVESGRRLDEFPVIAFSVPFENDYPGVPGILMAAGIPPLSRDRSAGHPFLLGGGVSISMNPEPLAPFLDLIHVGELDDRADRNIFTVIAENPEILNELAPSSMLDIIEDIPGVYAPEACRFEYDDSGLISDIRAEPGFSLPVKAVKRRSKGDSVPISVLFADEAEFGENFLIEMNRGCGRGCRFCAGGWIHFPVRHAEFTSFQSQIDTAIAAGRTIGLIGSDLAGHPELKEILNHIVESGGKFSLSSIRPEGLTPEIIDLISRTGQKTATLAPETASPRLKKVIGKNIPSERFLELTERLVAAGIPNVRFYFMVGLPTEIDEDAQAIVDFVQQARERFVSASKPKGKIGRISVQLNPFVPKPWTPFQWAAMVPGAVLERRIKLIRKGLKNLPNVILRVESYKQAYIQGVLSRGDRSIAKYILEAAQNGNRWSGIARKNAADLDFFALRERGLDEIFPWDVTDHGVSKKTLSNIYVKSIEKYAIS
jgi:radical SAM superfamily enzyme YgiQ (UPF0313 family)